MPPKKDCQEIKDEEDEVQVQISFGDLAKSMTIFTGDDTYPIQTFLDEFEDVADIMNWSKVEKLVYAKRLLEGTAKLFLRSFGRVRDYETLKKALKEEFSPKINSAVIHKRLASRKMRHDETYQQYFLFMKELALHGDVEDAALMVYVIDGIRDAEPNKSILYGATDMKEFRKKLDIYSDFRNKMINKPVPPDHVSTNYVNNKTRYFKRCYNCGSLDHQSPTCPKGVKCFKCNEFGHKSTECSKMQKVLNVRIKDDRKEVPRKEIKINGIENTCLIDTGSDFNIIAKSEFEKVRGIKNYETEATTCLTGIAGTKVYTEGSFIADVQIDGYYADIKFHVVKDDETPVNIIIGNPILSDFEVHFIRDRIYMEKIEKCTLLVEEKNEQINMDDSKNENIFDIMCEEYTPNEKKQESNVDLERTLNDEKPASQSQIKECIDDEMMKPIKCDVASPILLTDRKDGLRRMYVDNRKLNRKGVKGDKEKAKKLLEEVKEEEISYYNRKRKKANSYEMGDLGSMKKTQFSHGAKLYCFMKPWISPGGDLSGTDK